MQRAYSASSQPTTAAPEGGPTPITLPPPPRTLGSKIPINRRHKRRR
jgi:hypothetical protein